MDVREYRGFSALPESVLALMDEAGETNFFVSRAWVSNFLENAMNADEQPRLLAAHEGDTASALLLMRTPAGQNGSRFVLRRRKPSPMSLASMTSYQSPLFAPVVAARLDPFRALLPLAQALRSAQPRWRLLDFSTLDPETPLHDALARALRAAGYSVHGYFYFGNQYATAGTGGYDGYLAALPKSSRKQVKNYERKQRKLERARDVSFEVLRAPADADRAVALYEEISERSWKEPETYDRFVPGLIHAAAAAGALRLGVLFVDGTPAAFEFAVVRGGKATLMKTAYDERFKSESVGAVAMLRIVQHLLREDGVAEFDLGLDEAPYKIQWAPLRRERRGLMAFDLRTGGGVWQWLRLHGEHVDQKLRDLAKVVLRRNRA